jgi:hypothetical protein
MFTVARATMNAEQIDAITSSTHPSALGVPIGLEL